MKVDLSPGAITTRLRLTSELRGLCISLGKCKIELNVRKESKPNIRTDGIMQK